MKKATKKTTKKTTKRATKRATKKATRKFWKTGKRYFVRTVTNYLTGELVSMDAQELVFTDAAWIANTGRFADYLKSGKPDEVEPYPDGQPVLVERGAIVDAVPWVHELPRQQK